MQAVTHQDGRNPIGGLQRACGPLTSREAGVFVRWLGAVCCMIVLGGTAGTVTLYATGLVAAQSAEASPRRVRRACRGDYKRLCPRYRAGTSRMRNCMRANGSQISWGCYEALRDYGYIDGRRKSRRRGRRRR